MLYVIHCVDKPDSVALRLANREAHLAYLEGKPLVFGGPFLAEDETTMNGSLLVIDVADRAAAEEFAVNDPYRKAGLFERVDIRAWKKVTG
jgi:uncharacterized protein YciI